MYKSPIAENYKLFLESIREPSRNIKDCNFQLFLDMYKIREYLWVHKVEFHREKDITLSEIFQDLVAKYVAMNLGDQYTVVLERYYQKVQPDILILKNDKPYSVIEVKTMIGYNRDLVEEDNYKLRINEISKTFGIHKDKVIYVFESCANVSSGFKEIFESNRASEIKKHIFPLFLEPAHPFHVKKSIAQKDRKMVYEVSSDQEITDWYSRVNLNNFQNVIDKIR